ncbi:MAG: chemotaxis protein CheW [Deltaproteobacteria bacterium]
MENIENSNAVEENKTQEMPKEQIKQIEEEEYESEESQYVIFKIDTQDYGIEIKYVHEINRFKEVVINPVPKTPDYVEGIINLRGEVVPVLDLRKKIGAPVKEIGRETRILIVKIDNKTIGLIVDMVLKVINIDPKDITITPEEISDINTRFFSGITRLEKKITLLLNIDEVLKLEE